MRNLTILVVSAVLLFGGQLALTQLPTAKPSTLDYINNTLNPATVLLFHQQDDGTMKFACTATAIDYNIKDDTYMFATAAHCVVDKHQPYISLDENGTDKVFVRPTKSSCGKAEEGEDVCILFVKTKTHFKIVDLGDDPISGEPIVSVESPAGMGKQVLHGYIALNKLDRTIHDKEAKLDWTNDVILQLPGVLGGSSGSSVVCETSLKICAITVGVYANDLGQMQVAVPVSRLKALISKESKKEDKDTKDEDE